jgi:hypothetical protein
MHQGILRVSFDPPQFLYHATEVVMAPLGEGIPLMPDLFENLIFMSDNIPRTLGR